MTHPVQRQSVQLGQKEHLKAIVSMLFSNTVMSRIKAGAYGRKSRGSNHASIQVMLLFKTCFYVNIISLHCAVHTATHVLCKNLHVSLHRAASIQIVLLCHGALRKIGFYSSHASIQVMLLYSTLRLIVCYMAAHCDVTTWMR